MSDSFSRKAFLRVLENLRGGELEIVCHDRSYRFGEVGHGLRACVAVHDDRFFSRVLWGGDDAAGDSFVDGDWSSPDLVSVLRLATRNAGALESGTRLYALASRLAGRLQHWMNRNTIDGSRRNIEAHYDLSNDFFRLFLDRNLVYSSAVFQNADDTLEQAQVEKLDRLCRKLRLSPADHVLEIGTGWGAFALHASRRYGCRVTTTTISREQHAYARRAFDAAGEAGSRIELLLEDYRKLRGAYTKLVSIEMFEAVGFAYYDTFFSACDRLLAPDGSMAMQTITVGDHRFAEYRKNMDWIQQRIFPGAELASVGEILRSLARSTRLSLFHLEDIGVHYAYTLREWRRRYHASMAEVERLGFDAYFRRSWDFYLAYCEAAFLERHISDVQIVLTRHGNTANLYGEPWDPAQGGTVEKTSAACRETS